MRRIWTSTSNKMIEKFSRELEAHEIPHSVDSEKDMDWGSDSYGTVFFSLWAHDDTDVDRARALLTQVSGAPEDSPYVLPNASVNSPLKQFLQLKFPFSFSRKSLRRDRSPWMTILIVFLCVLLYGVDQGTMNEVPELKPPYSPSFTSSPVRQALLFDYPLANILEDTLLASYGPDSLNPTAKLNPNGVALRDEFLKTPYWGGVYTEVVKRLSKRDLIPTPSLSLSLIGERIRDGQVWRAITPCFVHANIFHLVFNLTWIIALGSQIDRRLSAWRYLLLIACIAIISNTAQYLMTGPNFAGISGVVCGMIGFIAARQRTAPWESYQLSPLMYSLLLFFIWFLVAMSGVSFFLESYLRAHFVIDFANTAHLTGLAAGLALGKTRWFAMRRTI